MQKTFHSTLAALALSLVSVHVLLLFDYVRTLLQLLLLALFLCCFSLSWLGSSHIWPSAWQVKRGIILIARINPWMNGQPRLDFPSRIPRLLVFPSPPLPSPSFPFLFSSSQGKVYYLFIYRRAGTWDTAASNGGSLHVSVWTWESSIFTFMHAHTHTQKEREDTQTHTHTAMHVSRRGRHISSTGLPDVRTIKDETPWIGYIRRWRTLKVAFIIVIYL